MQSGPIYDMRQDCIQQVQAFRDEHNERAAGDPLKTLKENANAQRVAQHKAWQMADGAPDSGVPADTRNPLARAHDNDIGASDAVKVIELCGTGATSVYAIMQGFIASTDCHVGLLDPQVGYIGVGIEVSAHRTILVVQLIERPMDGAPELPEMEEFPSFSTPDNGMGQLTLPGSVVQVSCETAS
jgi:uncharacterized protein YkwD